MIFSHLHDIVIFLAESLIGKGARREDGSPFCGKVDFSGAERIMLAGNDHVGGKESCWWRTIMLVGKDHVVVARW